MDGLTMICEEELEEKIGMVQRQTDYSKEVAREKLLEKQLNPILVIKDFLGIPEKKPERVVSVQQAIYKQLRSKMNSSIKDYNEKQDKKLEAEIMSNNT